MGYLSGPWKKQLHNADYKKQKTHTLFVCPGTLLLKWRGKKFYRPRTIEIVEAKKSTLWINPYRSQEGTHRIKSLLITWKYFLKAMTNLPQIYVLWAYSLSWWNSLTINSYIFAYLRFIPKSFKPQHIIHSFIHSLPPSLIYGPNPCVSFYALLSVIKLQFHFQRNRLYCWTIIKFASESAFSFTMKSISGCAGHLNEWQRMSPLLKVVFCGSGSITNGALRLLSPGMQMLSWQSPPLGECRAQVSPRTSSAPYALGHPLYPVFCRVSRLHPDILSLKVTEMIKDDQISVVTIMCPRAQSALSSSCHIQGQ